MYKIQRLRARSQPSTQALLHSTQAHKHTHTHTHIKYTHTHINAHTTHPCIGQHGDRLSFQQLDVCREQDIASAAAAVKEKFSTYASIPTCMLYPLYLPRMVLRMACLLLEAPHIRADTRAAFLRFLVNRIISFGSRKSRK